jgi:biopolymer transport protein ExbD
MPLKIEKMAESELNMTPMIDIVFQLILFFLFNLRFKSQEYRIESALPKDRGVEATPQMVQPIPAIKVILFRLNATDDKKAQTKIKIGNNWEKILKPYNPTGQRTLDLELEKERDVEYQPILAKIQELLKGNPELKGEIDTPPPSGNWVPHADVMRVLDAFLAAGVTDVNFVGAATPLPRAAAAAR